MGRLALASLGSWDAFYPSSEIFDGLQGRPEEARAEFAPMTIGGMRRLGTEVGRNELPVQP